MYQEIIVSRKNNSMGDFLFQLCGQIGTNLPWEKSFQSKNVSLSHMWHFLFVQGKF